MKEYKSREYCKYVGCLVLRDLETTKCESSRKIIKEACKRCEAYKFHQYLKERGYKIIKQDIRDWDKTCMCCMREFEKVIKLEQFKENIILCEKCNNIFVVKMAKDGLPINEAMKYFNTINENIKKRDEIIYGTIPEME